MEKLLELEKKLIKMREELEEHLYKSEAKPEKEGSFHGETHKLVQERGERTVMFPGKDKNTGKDTMIRKKIPNKVEITHVWDHNNKKWNHKDTKNVLGGANTGSPDYKTPNSEAEKKMKAHEDSKNSPKVETKPKTIVRKK